MLLVLPSLASIPTGALAGRVLSLPERPAATAVWIAPSLSPGAPVRAEVAEDGSFTAEGLPAGAAELAIETAGGLYVVTTPVAIAPGTTRHLQLALGGRQDTSPAPPPEQKSRRPGGVWANPLYATLIVVGSAIVLGVIISELTQPDDEPTPSASESNP
jgi:hypothetical protein